MARKYTRKDVHGSPEKAGAQNLAGVQLPKDESGLMEKLMPIYHKGTENRGRYSGQWTDADLKTEVLAFFEYCMGANLKPTVPGLLLWLSITRQTLWEWRTKPEKYGEKSYIIQEAYALMEYYLQGNIDKYPTGSIFLLKTTHGHVEQSKLDITTNGETVKTASEIQDLVNKLGIDKK